MTTRPFFSKVYYMGLTESPHHGVHPVAPFAAGGALSARLVLVKEGQPGDGLDHVGLLVHDDDGGGAKAGLGGHKRVEVHQNVVTNPERSNAGLIFVPTFLAKG